jgi:hypothetical protein
MAAVALGVGGFIAVTVSKKPPPKASVTLILALPIEHYDVKSHEDYKQEKHKLLRYNFKLTDDQVINIRKYTYRGTPFEKVKSNFEKIGQDHKEQWKDIIVTFDRPALKYADIHYPAVILSYGDSVAFTKEPPPFMVSQITLSPVVPVPYMEYDREFTEQLYVSTGLKYDVEDGVDTDATWDKFKHPRIRQILDAARKTLE